MKKKSKVPKQYGFVGIVITCAAILVLELLFPTYVERFIDSSNLRFLPIILITHQLMHANFAHFFGNMFFVAPLALIYEKKVGTKTFLLHWFSSGVVAALFFMAMPRILGIGDGNLIGASGACSGMLALGLLSYKESSLHEALAMAALIAFFMMNLLNGVVDCVIPSGVAHMAHVGGMLCGVMIHCLRRSREVVLSKP